MKAILVSLLCWRQLVAIIVLVTVVVITIIIITILFVTVIVVIIAIKVVFLFVICTSFFIAVFLVEIIPIRVRSIRLIVTYVPLDPFQFIDKLFTYSKSCLSFHVAIQANCDSISPAIQLVNNLLLAQLCTSLGLLTDGSGASEGKSGSA